MKLAADLDTRIVPRSLWQRIRAQPERAPEHIALAAADRFGAQAAHWASGAGQGKRAARRAVRKHVRLARLEGGALGLGGFVTAVPDLVALGWVQSGMVFHVAAAYGHDPTDPMRPAELLTLTGFYDTPEQAREALDGTGKSLARATVERGLSGGQERTLFNRLLRFAGRQAAERSAGRLVPLIGAPIGALQNGGATKRLGRRAIAYYGGRQARP
ncbi:MAG: EcsC family protein [Thermoleophilaceae bacterium]